MTTWCIDCDHAHPATREQDPWRWRCLRAPVQSGFGFVHPTFSPTPPYDLCSRVNRDGDCKMYEPKRESDVQP